MKRIIPLSLVVLFACVLNACSGAGASKYTAISYEDIPTVSDMNSYHSEVKKDGKNNDDPIENGVVTCPYYTLKINGKEVPVYSTRCGESVHSFAWIDVDEAETSIALNVKLSLKNAHEEVVVLPESSGVEATMKKNTVTAKITSLGSFSFAFDKKVEEALTIYVAKEEKLNTPSGYTVQEFDPGTYSGSDTSFSQENTVYYFKKGVYNISSIYLPSNSMLYFENGTYVNVITESSQDRNAAIRSSKTENIEVCGRALFDFSQSQGGQSKFKGVYNFMNVDTARFSGITTINSNNWSLCFTDSNDVVVENNMLLGYRTFSDGIMMSDCQDSIVRNNFVRTGDDAVEVKSTGSEGTKNMLYEYNAVWTDKALAYGCVFECNNSAKNVVFRNNSVGFYLPTWIDRLGCCMVFMGNRRTTTWEDIYFENIEIYITNSPLVNVFLQDTEGNGIGGGKAKDIYFKNISAYRSYGQAVYIRVENGSSLGKVYLDNITFNETKLDEKDISTSDSVFVQHYSSSWSPSANIKVNTLTDEE